MKEKIVSQENLKKLANQNELGKRIIVSRFDAKNKNWLPAGYYVPKSLGTIFRISRRFHYPIKFFENNTNMNLIIIFCRTCYLPVRSATN